jgi:hypothetical protein
VGFPADDPDGETGVGDEPVPKGALSQDILTWEKDRLRDTGKYREKKNNRRSGKPEGSFALWSLRTGRITGCPVYLN